MPGAGRCFCMELSNGFRFPSEEEMAKHASGLALELSGQLGYADYPDFPLSPLSEASLFSPVLDFDSSEDLIFDTCNCVYCGVGMDDEVMSLEWDQRICDSCTRALTSSPRSAKRQGQQFQYSMCHHCGIHLEGAHVQVDGHAYCQEDYDSLFGLECVGCGERISDSYVEALQGVWHKSCFSCADCGHCVAEGKSFLLEGDILCERDYYSRLDAICLVCQEPLKGICLSTPDGKQKFHPNHFQCHRCHKPLPPSSFTKESGHFICLDCNH